MMKNQKTVAKSEKITYNSTKGGFYMIVRFVVENFMSFKDATEFSMVAGKMTRHSNHIAICKDKRILKGSFIFGANASGKTNLMRAIAFAKNVVSQGLENTNTEKKYYRIDSSYKNKPGVFQFDIFAGGHFYSYGFAISYTNSLIEEEWLYRIDDDKEFCVFLRSKLDNTDDYSFNSDIKIKDKIQQERFNVYSSDISTAKMKKTLFLADIVMRSPDDEQHYQAFRDVMAWFDNLYVIFPNSKYEGMTELLDNDNEKTRLETLLNYFDTGINSVLKKDIDFAKAFAFLPESVLDKIKADLINTFDEIEDENQSVLIQQDNTLVEIKCINGELLASEILSNHGNDDDLFEYNDESDGTQRLFDLIPVYQKALDNCVILIDELDRSLHTKAAQEFIKYFYELAENSTTQLIVTTHDSNIMDLDFIRQDEIWFIERNPDHSSIVYSLNKFKARFDKKVEKEYLLGRYGALPVFSRLAFNTELIDDGDDNE